MSEVEERLAAVEARRAERKAALKAQEQEQRVVDLEAIDVIEETRGDGNVKVLSVPYVPGLPVLIAVRTPLEVEVKRFRSKAKSEDKEHAMHAVAELGETCIVYPDREVAKAIAKARPNLMMNAGNAAIELSLAASDAEGKG